MYISTINGNIFYHNEETKDLVEECSDESCRTLAYKTNVTYNISLPYTECNQNIDTNLSYLFVTYSINFKAYRIFQISVNFHITWVDV